MRKFYLLSILVSLVTLHLSAKASRVLEVEQFYQEKVKEILETRFPSTPFSVFVNVDTGRPEPTRREIQNSKNKEITKLPFWYSDEGIEDVDIWERPDVPIGTLIKQLRSVVVTIRVDATLKDEELKELQDVIAKQLKLDPGLDRIEISRMNWTDQERYRTIGWVGGLGAIAFLVLVLSFWLLARLSIARLVSGLTKPIAEIGNSTKKFANSALELASDLSQGQKSKVGELDSGGQDESTPMDLNLLEIRKSALELLDRNRHLFETPDAEFLEFLERKGAADPITMGSILAELEQATLRTLVRYGAGDWWYKAVAQPAPLKAQSLAMLGEIDRLRVRRQFQDTHSEESAQHREFALTLNRLKAPEVASVMSGLSLEEAQPIIELLPRDLALAVGKALFPGQWAVFIDRTSDPAKIKPQILKDLSAKAQKLRPLREEDEIKSFFRDLDLTEYLDSAPPRDERDFYLVLPELSRIRVQRYPFFKVFEGSDKVLKTLGSMFSPGDWAIALLNCDQGERRMLLEKFTDRLRFQVVERLSQLDRSENSIETSVRRIRRQIVRALQEEEHRQDLKAAQSELTSARMDSSDGDSNSKAA